VCEAHEKSTLSEKLFGVLYRAIPGYLTQLIQTQWWPTTGFIPAMPLGMVGIEKKMCQAVRSDPA
jgi:hypothetical protein